MKILPDENADPEDGITPEMGKQLNARKDKDKISTWHALWKLLFPEDDLARIPSEGKKSGHASLRKVGL